MVKTSSSSSNGGLFTCFLWRSNSSSCTATSDTASTFNASTFKHFQRLWSISTHTTFSLHNSNKLWQPYQSKKEQTKHTQTMKLAATRAKYPNSIQDQSQQMEHRKLYASTEVSNPAKDMTFNGPLLHTWLKLSKLTLASLVVEDRW